MDENKKECFLPTTTESIENKFALIGLVREL